ncbi:MAG: hypothetical protein AAGF01_13570 [Cyanobacteria bacterium P01_G01_bin.38]
MPATSSLPSSRENWAQIFAFAWLESNQDFSKELRRDPKETIIELAKGTSGKYKPLLDSLESDTADLVVDAANEIKKKTDDTPLAAYSGYLPIPNSPFREELLKELNEGDLEKLLDRGIEGILQFQEKKELWAEILLRVWRNSDELKKIRQEPLEGLSSLLGEQQARELQDSEYGIIPLPNRPRGLGTLTIEDLADFLGDQDNADHLGGIFLVAT